MTLPLETNDPFARLRGALSADDHARIDVMAKVQAHYHVMKRDKRIEQAFTHLFEDTLVRYDPTRAAGEDNRIELRGLAILGNSGAGKSRALRYFFAGHAAFPGYGDLRSDCQAISVEVRAPTTHLGLGHRIMAATGFPVRGKVTAHQVWEMVYERLRLKRIFVIHLNELHNFFLTCKDADRKDLLNSIKSFMTNPTWPVIVVVSGLPMLKEVLEGHDEDRRRFSFIPFRPLRVPASNPVLKQIAEKLADIAGLILPPDFEEDIVPRLAWAADHEWGTCIKIMHNAVRFALNVNEKTGLARTVLERDRFAEAWGFMTGSGREANPFVIRNWRDVGCKLVMRDDTKPDPEPTGKKRK